MLKIVGSFIKPESNVNLQPKKREVTEKKTPLPKGMNIKTKIKKILRCEDPNGEIEIGSD